MNAHLGRRDSGPLGYDLRGIEARDLLRFWPLQRGPSRRRSHSELYYHSKPVRRLHVFISHSWSASPLIKYAVLSFRYNTPFAFCLSFLTFIILRILGIDDSLCFIGMWIGLVCGYLWGGRASFDRTLLFFDQCCIHQDDEDKKLEGIRHIGDYLTRAEGFVIFWSQDYNTRLWCVFELACYIKSANLPCVEIWPIPILQHRFVIMTMHQFYWVLVTLVRETSARLVIDAFYIVATGLYCMLVDGKSRIECQMLLSSFDSSVLKCFIQSDREMIMKHIKKQYGNYEEFRSHAERIFSQLDQQWNLNSYTVRVVLLTCFPTICCYLITGRILAPICITCLRIILLISFYGLALSFVLLDFVSPRAHKVCRIACVFVALSHLYMIRFVTNFEEELLATVGPYKSWIFPLALVIEMVVVGLLKKVLCHMTYTPHIYMAKLIDFIKA